MRGRGLGEVPRQACDGGWAAWLLQGPGLKRRRVSRAGVGPGQVPVNRALAAVAPPRAPGRWTCREDSGKGGWGRAHRAQGYVGSAAGTTPPSGPAFPGQPSWGSGPTGGSPAPAWVPGLPRRHLAHGQLQSQRFRRAGRLEDPQLYRRHLRLPRRGSRARMVQWGPLCAVHVSSAGTFPGNCHLAPPPAEVTVHLPTWETRGRAGAHEEEQGRSTFRFANIPRKALFTTGPPPRSQEGQELFRPQAVGSPSTGGGRCLNHSEED